MNCTIEEIKKNNINEAIEVFKGNGIHFINKTDNVLIGKPSSKFTIEQLSKITEANVNRTQKWINTKFKNPKFQNWITVKNYKEEIEILFNIPNNLKKAWEIKLKNISLEQYQKEFDVLNKEANVKVEDGEVKPIFLQLNNTSELKQKGIIASEKTIRDLAAKIADRIGMSVKFESDRSKDYKGKIENNVAYVNLAYATLDTPIHEILGHPIIRAIKNRSQNQEDSSFNKLYENLLEELSTTQRGKEVLDRIKRDYTNKTNEYDYSKGEKISDEEYDNIKASEENTGSDEYLGRDFYEKRIGDKVYTIQKGEDANPNSARVYTLPTYSLEEQQEEAIVELLGLMTAEKLDAVKDGKLISLLKRLLKEMKAFIRSLINQKEVEIDKLPDNMTINDLADILAYSNSKLILPGYEVEYTTPDNMKFKTYQEASNHISKLAKSVEDVDLDDVTINIKDFNIPAHIKNFSNNGFYYRNFNNNWQKVKETDTGTEGDYENISLNEAKDAYKNTYTARPQNTPLNNFIKKNKEYEQSKEIIEEWKRVNNIQYNPEEIYSRGQEFSSVVGAYSNFDVNLMMQNLLQHIEDNEKAGGKFAISAYTKPIDKQIGHLEGGGGKIKFKLYPQSNDILWAANTDVYSGSVWDASEKVNKDKKSELLGVSYTKYPSLRSINTVQPNLANIIDNLNHHHNELGITLTGNNFRLEYDENIPYQTKKIIDGINKILDQKYGKLVKPEINKTNSNATKLTELQNKLRDLEEQEQDLFSTSNYESIDGTYAEKLRNQIANINKQIQNLKNTKSAGIQPTQTNDNLKESIENIKNSKNIDKNKNQTIIYLKERLEDLNNVKILKSNKNKDPYKDYDRVVFLDEVMLYEQNKEFFFVDLTEQYAEPNSISKEQFEKDLLKYGDSKKIKIEDDYYLNVPDKIFSFYERFNTEKEAKDFIKNEKETVSKKLESLEINKEKEYTSQALINTKITALKEIAKAQPRSLIRSEVKPINRFDTSSYEQFDELEDLPFQKIPSKEEEVTKQKASPELINLMKQFIKQIGVDYNIVKNIVDANGVKQDANGVALIIQKLIQVVEGKEDEALPEEAMHFVVEIVKQTNPKLYQQLLKEINGHPTLNKVVELYGNHANYQTNGKRDFLKLKEEAIAQVLANNLEDVLGRTLWEKIVDFFKGLFFARSGMDQASMNVLSGKIASVEDIDVSKAGAYYQLSQGEKIFNDILNTSNEIKPVPNGVDENGKEKTTYELNGEKAIKRVSDFAKEYYAKIFKNIESSDFEKAVNDLKAEKGTEGHSDIEYAFKMLVDPSTGLMREKMLDDEDYISKLNPKNRRLYEILRNNLKERLLAFEEKHPDSRFLSEVKVFDKKRKWGGMIDFVAISSEGKVSILDWKFITLNEEKFTDIPWYKVAAWDIQMKKYKDIISTNYNVKNENFEQTRMIPILARYTKADYEKQILPKLTEIKIGDVNVQNVDEDYLLPVGITTEKTGEKRIDSLIEKLNSIYSKLASERVNEEEKSVKAEQLASLYKAIRHLHIKGNVVPLINQAKILNKQVSMLINRYDNEFKGKEASSVEQEKINAFSGMLRIHLEALSPYLDLDQLRFLLKDDTKENEELKKTIINTVQDVKDYLYELKELDEKFAKEFNNASTTPEKVVKGVTKWFSSIATIQMDNIQSLYKLTNKAFFLANQETLEQNKILKNIKSEYDKWALSKGLNLRNYFNILTKKDKNELIDQFDSKFYSELKSKITKKDFNWITSNIDEQAYKEHLDKKLEKEKDRIFSTPIVGTKEEVNTEIKKQLAKVYTKYDIASKESNGWLLYDDIKQFPKKDVWESTEYKELNKPENIAAKNFYNYIIERNKYYQSIGYLNGKAARKFLPWIRQGFVEGLVFEGKSRGIGEDFLRNISMDEGEAGYGEKDPVTGELINTIPKYFTTDLGEGYSTDLFKTFSLYNDYAIKFKNLSNVEESSLQLLRIERNKKSLMTSQFNNLIIEEGVPKFNETNYENSKLLEDMIKGVVYQQKFLQSETFDMAMGKISNFGKNINQKLGMNIFPENLEGRQVSFNKTIDTINKKFQLNTLGLNTLSSISNYFGGSINGIINAGKYFTKADIIKTQMWFLANKMQGTVMGKDSLGNTPQKALAALDYFLPFLENYNRDAGKKLSLNKLDGQALQDYLMVMMRSGEDAIQTVNFFTFLKNAVVINGEIVNVREHLKSTDEYKTFYSGTQEERKARKNKFEEDVEKLIDEKGVLKIGEIIDGEFSIPGVDKKSDSVMRFRRLVQSFTSDALGSMSEENRRLVNMNVYSSSFMVFKNWIPRLVDVRIGNIKYNAASDAYEWGRMRMMFGMITTDFIKSTKSLTAALSGNGDVWLEQVRALYEKKQKDYENSTGKTLEMTEDEFIDLVNQNIKNQAVDVIALLSLMSLLAILKANAPDDDEDAKVKNQWKFYVKATDKLTDELTYFYDPSSPFNLISKGVFPSIALLENYIKFITNFSKENFGLIIDDEKMQDDAHPIKYLMKSFPMSSQAAGILPMFYPEVAKDLGIQMQGQYGIR